jgi:tetratricopeptide (TPR) repeat protein
MLLWLCLTSLYVWTLARPAGIGASLFAASGFEPMAPRSRAVERAIGERRFRDALPIVDSLQRSYPNHPLPAYLAALTFRGLDRPAEEAAAWEDYLRSSAHPVDACPHIAEAYERSGDGSRALTALTRCAEFDPKEPERWLDLGDGFARAGQEDRAAAAWRRALDVDPLHPIAAARLSPAATAGGRP